jgi:hypothetical protein
MGTGLRDAGVLEQMHLEMLAFAESNRPLPLTDPNHQTAGHPGVSPVLAYIASASTGTIVSLTLTPYRGNTRWQVNQRKAATAGIRIIASAAARSAELQ